MKGHRRFSLIDRFVAGTQPGLVPEASGQSSERVSAAAVRDDVPLKGSALEQAYRDLMLENQVLSESNGRLHERLSRVESGLEESPAAKQLIQAQRNALAERSHRLREVQYENLNLKREQKKLLRENQKLAADLERHMRDMRPLMEQQEVSRRELEAAKAALREKTNELAKLTDKYYQLEARSKPRSSAGGGL